MADGALTATLKRANIIPIPRTAKPADLNTRYRPISLLSPCVKVLSRSWTSICSTVGEQKSMKIMQWKKGGVKLGRRFEHIIS